MNIFVFGGTDVIKCIPGSYESSIIYKEIIILFYEVESDDIPTNSK